MNDLILASAAHFAELPDPVNCEVVLNVHGLLISGTVIDHKEYWQHNVFVRSLWEGLEAADEADGEKAKTVELAERKFLHLKDARYYAPGANPVPNNQGQYIRVNLEHVGSFHFGALEASVISVPVSG